MILVTSNDNDYENYTRNEKDNHRKMIMVEVRNNKANDNNAKENDNDTG